MLDQIIVNGIVAGFSYALVAFGFALIYNTTRIFHFAHGAIYTFCVYFVYSLNDTWSWWITIPLGLAVTALLGVMIDEVVYRPLVRKKSSLLLQLLSSLAAYMIIVNLIIMVYGNEIKILNPDIQETHLVVSNVILSDLQIATVICAIGLLTLVAVALRVTKAGKMIRALRDDVELLSALGVNSRYLRWLVFALGSALAGVAAVLQGLDVGTNPNADLIMFVSGAVAAIIGGRRIFEAAILGALIIGVLHAFAVWEFSGRWEESASFLLLILFLLVRPEGIFARTRRVEESEA